MNRIATVVAIVLLLIACASPRSDIQKPGDVRTGAEVEAPQYDQHVKDYYKARGNQ